MIGVKITVGLLGLGLALLPSTTLADPTDEAQKEVQLDPEYAAGKAAIAAKDWSAAIRSLSSAALRDTRNADIENYLGYAYRQSGQLQLAFTHYQRALQLDPRHRGVHEYIGEAYLITNNLTKAEEHLAALQRICLIPARSMRTSRRPSPTTGHARQSKPTTPAASYACAIQAAPVALARERSIPVV